MWFSHVIWSWAKMTQHVLTCLCASVFGFLYFCSNTCMFVSLHIHTSLWVLGLVSLCSPPWPSLLLHTYTFASVSECLHVLLHGLHVSRWICLCLQATSFWVSVWRFMSLEKRNSNETWQMAPKCLGRHRMKHHSGSWLSRCSAHSTFSPLPTYYLPRRT